MSKSNSVATPVVVFASVWLIVAITVLSFFGACKLAGAWFNQSPDLSTKALVACEARHGTPVLENSGDSYKSCTVPGISNVTSNKVQ